MSRPSSTPPTSTATADQAFKRFQETGNIDFLAEVFDATAGKLLRVAHHLVHDLHTAEDLVQATYLVAISQKHQYGGKTEVLSWLFGILHRTALMKHRELRRKGELDQQSHLAQLARGTPPEPSQILEEKEFSEAVARAIGHLPEAYRPVLNLYLRYGMTPSEIALNLERPPATVRTQLARGLEKLRSALPSSLIAGAVALTVPVQGLSAMRAVVLEKASVSLAAKSAAVTQALSRPGHSSGLGLWTGAGILAVVTVGAVLLVAKAGEDVQQAASFDAATNFQDPDAAVLSDGPGRDSPVFRANLQRQGHPSSLPRNVVSSQLLNSNPRRITNMYSISSSSLQPSNALFRVSLGTSTLLFGASLFFPGLAQVQAQTPIFFIHGENATDQFGNTVNCADLNLDGYADMIVGSSPWDGPAGSNCGRVYAFSGRTGTLMYAVNGENASDSFGQWVNSADTNADGHPDILTAARGWDDPNGINACGRAYVISGKDASTLFTFNGEVALDQLGVYSNPVGDFNLDGYSDIAVSCWDWDDPVGPKDRCGRVYVLSGKDAGVITTFNGENAGDFMGIASGGGDVNLDGYPDIMIASRGWDYPVGPISECGRVYVFSGKDNSTLYTYDGEKAGNHYGFSVGLTADLNLDGYVEMVATSCYWSDPNGFSSCGKLDVYSSQTGSILYTLQGGSAGELFGYRINTTSDMNLDGATDLVVNATNWKDLNGPKSNVGRVYVYSGLSAGTLLDSVHGDNANDRLGQGLGTGDVNADGYPDLVAGAYGWDNPTGPITDCGRVYVYSFKGMALTADSHLLSISVASTQNLALDAGAANAGRSYWVFGNFGVSGTFPGVNLGAVNIPLNPDPWTQLTIDFANTPAFNMTKGTLDGSGEASGSLNSLAPQPTAPLGLTIQHCFLVYQAGPPDSYYMASNLVPWTTVP